MTKQQAKRLAAKITADPNAGATIIGLRIRNVGLLRFYEIDLQDHASGYMFTVGSPQDWTDRQEANEFAAQHGA